MKNLNRTYYYNYDGTKDEFAFSLNCMEAPIYLWVKNQLEDCTLFRCFFAKNFSLAVASKSGEIISARIPLITSNINLRDYVHIVEITPETSKALQTMKDLLAKYEYVMLQTVNTLLPFDSRYGEFNMQELTKFSPHHTNLFVGYNKSKFFYVENKLGVNPKEFIPLRSNPEIGIIDENALIPALNLYASFYCINKINDISELATETIREMVKSFYLDVCNHYFASPRMFEDGVVELHGKDALMCIASLCENGSVSLITIVNMNGRSDEFIRTIIMIIDDCRKALTISRYILLSLFTKLNEDIQQICESCIQAERSLTVIPTLFLKRFAEKKYALSSEDAMFFSRAATNVDLFVRKLRKWLEEKG